MPTVDWVCGTEGGGREEGREGRRIANVLGIALVQLIHKNMSCTIGILVALLSLLLTFNMCCMRSIGMVKMVSCTCM